MRNIMLQRYFQRMVNRIYKILPMKEMNEATLSSYLDSLLSQLVGMLHYNNLSGQPYYASIVATITYLNDNIDMCDQAKVRKQIFGTISLCKKLSDYYKAVGASECF